MHKFVPLDVASEIRELSDEGLGCDKIGALTGINSSTVKRIISGIHESYTDRLSPRQVQALLNGFGR